MKNKKYMVEWQYKGLDSVVLFDDDFSNYAEALHAYNQLVDKEHLTNAKLKRNTVILKESK